MGHIASLADAAFLTIKATFRDTMIFEEVDRLGGRLVISPVAALRSLGGCAQVSGSHLPV